MKKVLVFASDVVPVNGIATSGGGLRSWQFIQGLLWHGFNVVYSIPKNRFLMRQCENKIPAGILDLAWDPENQDALVESVKPDAIIFMAPDLNRLRKNHDAYMVCDIHGPRLIENELHSGKHSALNRAQLIQHSLESLRNFDYITCAGRLQSIYFSAWFLLAGFPLAEARPPFIPVSLSPEQPILHKQVDNPQFISSGGFYPWQNPFPGFSAVGELLASEDKGALQIYGCTHEISQENTDYVAEQIKQLSKNKHIHFNGLVSHEELLNAYSGAYVAVELMERSLEREIAFTTRTVEYLWAGIPVIYNDYSELSDYIIKYKAGWCVNPDDKEAIIETCRNILHHPEIVVEYSHNAQKLVRECFSWDKTIMPVVNFLKHPFKSNRAKTLSDTPLAYFSISKEKLAVSFWQRLLIAIIYRTNKILPEGLRYLLIGRLYELVELSPMFNAKWYLAKYPDVAKSTIRPSLHYLLHGWEEGRDPSPDFSTDSYLYLHPDAAKHHVCPLIHNYYIQ